MARKSHTPSFEQTLESLRAHSFDVSPYAGAAGSGSGGVAGSGSGTVSGGMLVTKHGVGAVLVPGAASARSENGGAQLAVSPGILVRGQIARLLDRGYQKFIKTDQFELPATADQLRAIHVFEEELNQVTGTLGLYNESLGTTSDLYQYDRLRGREAPQAAPARPWELTAGH